MGIKAPGSRTRPIRLLRMISQVSLMSLAVFYKGNEITEKKFSTESENGTGGTGILPVECIVIAAQARTAPAAGWWLQPLRNVAPLHVPLSHRASRQMLECRSWTWGGA